MCPGGEVTVRIVFNEWEEREFGGGITSSSDIMSGRVTVAYCWGQSIQLWLCANLCFFNLRYKHFNSTSTL